jgi:hypothetical protein
LQYSPSAEERQDRGEKRRRIEQDESSDRRNQNGTDYVKVRSLPEPPQNGTSALPSKPIVPPPPGGLRKANTGGGLFVPKASQRASLSTHSDPHRSSVDFKAVNASNMSSAERLRAELLSGNSAAPIARPKITGAHLAAAASNAPAAARIKAEMMADGVAPPFGQSSPQRQEPPESAAAPAAAEAPATTSQSGGIPGLDFDPVPAPAPVPEPVASTPAEEAASESMDFAETVETVPTGGEDQTVVPAVPAEAVPEGGEDQAVPAAPNSSPRGVKRTADEAEIPKTRAQAEIGEGVQEAYVVGGEEDEEEDEGNEEEVEEEEEEDLSNVGPMKPAPLKLLGNNMAEQEDTVK